MAKRIVPRPTDAELQILQVLWRQGPSTVRQVLDALKRRKRTGIGYTTVLKLMQIMTEKGLVARDETQRSHVYRAALSEEQIQRQLVSDLLDKAFGGSARKLVMQALAAKRTPAKQLEQIRRILDQLEGESHEYG